jgi:hypothetical protein
MVRPSRRRWYRSIESEVPVGPSEPGIREPAVSPADLAADLTLRGARDGSTGVRAAPAGNEKGEDASDEAPPPWSRGPKLSGSPSCVVKRPAAGRRVCRMVRVCVQYLCTRPFPPGLDLSPPFRPPIVTKRCPGTPRRTARGSFARPVVPRAPAQPSWPDSAGSQMLNAAPRSAAAGSRTRSPSIALQSSRET